MKINLKDTTNKKVVDSVRSQIKDSGDLGRFDEFLARNDTFDLSDQRAVDSAKQSCGSDEGPCCKIVINIPPIRL